MDAKEVGTLVKDWVEDFVRAQPPGDREEALDDRIKFVDHLGTSLIMQGCSIMMEAGAPPDVVLARAVAITKSYAKHQAKEALEASVQEQSVVQRFVQPPKIIISS